MISSSLLKILTSNKFMILYYKSDRYSFLFSTFVLSNDNYRLLKNALSNK